MEEAANYKRSAISIDEELLLKEEKELKNREVTDGRKTTLPKA